MFRLETEEAKEMDKYFRHCRWRASIIRHNKRVMDELRKMGWKRVTKRIPVILEPITTSYRTREYMSIPTECFVTKDENGKWNMDGTKLSSEIETVELCLDLEDGRICYFSSGYFQLDDETFKAVRAKLDIMVETALEAQSYPKKQPTKQALMEMIQSRKKEKKMYRAEMKQKRISKETIDKLSEMGWRRWTKCNHDRMYVDCRKVMDCDTVGELILEWDEMRAVEKGQHYLDLNTGKIEVRPNKSYKEVRGTAMEYVKATIYVTMAKMILEAENEGGEKNNE